MEDYEGVRINGVLLDPQPSFNGGLKWTSNDVHSADSGRTEDAMMHITIVGVKHTLKFTFPRISIQKASAILSTMDSTYFPVTYMNPETAEVETITCYKGNREAGYYSYVTDKEITGLSFTVIEQ